MSLIFPTPVCEKLVYTARTESKAVCISLDGFEAAEAEKRFEMRGIKTSATPDLAITLEYRENLSDEEYKLNFENGAVPSHCTLYASSKKGVRYGANAVAGLILRYENISGTVSDSPSFSRRGIIEGFYGKPWRAERRLDMLKTVSFWNMNTYFYAPKDDEYHRDRWDEPYDEKSFAALREVVEACREYGLEFVYCIAPGITMEYSSAEHLKKLDDKLGSVRDLGVRSFSLLLDDIPSSLQYDSDKKAFGDLTKAHIAVTNQFARMCREADKDARLFVCPYMYCGTGEEDYIRRFGRGIDPDVRILWTGRDICSREITTAQAEKFHTETGHYPFFWDNYPVNDANMYNEMHLGPVRDRDARLYRFSEGLIANGMEYSEASKAGFMTVADYLWNSEAYDPETSHINAMKRLVGEDGYGKFRFFSDNLQTCCLRNSNSELMSEYLQQVRFSMKTGDFDKAVGVLKEYCGKMNDCCCFLESGMNNRFLREELKPWTDKFVFCCEILNTSLVFLSSGGKLKRRELSDMTKKYKSDPVVLADFCFWEFTEFLLDYRF